MGKKYTTEITTNASGASSQRITLEPGVWNIFVQSEAWGDVDLQGSHDGVNWYDLKDYQGEIVNFTENYAKEINGGILLRLWANSISQPISLVAKKAS